MAPAGRQGYPKATIGTPKGDRVDHNRTTPSMEEDRICKIATTRLVDSRDSIESEECALPGTEYTSS